MVSDQVAACPKHIGTANQLPAGGGEVLLQGRGIALIRYESSKCDFEVLVPGAQAAPKCIPQEVMSFGVHVGSACSSSLSLEWASEGVLLYEVICLRCS